jgi:hypothetical protein
MRPQEGGKTRVCIFMASDLCILKFGSMLYEVPLGLVSTVDRTECPGGKCVQVRNGKWEMGNVYFLPECQTVRDD